MHARYSRIALAVAGALGVVGAEAAEVWLCAERFVKPLPDGSEVTMWGFAEAVPEDGTVVCGTPGVPGPRLDIPADDPGLKVHLQNNLGRPVSLVIPGQAAAMTPVMFTDDTGRQRVRSFTHETEPGTTGTYEWPDLRPGTYAYHSGTHPQVQVQMGLYGAAVRNAAAGEAYDGIGFDHELLLLYSEIDPALHEAVDPLDAGAEPVYGTDAYPSTINYRPRWFLVNGEPFTLGSAPLDAGRAGERTLVRLLNLGLKNHVAAFAGLHARVVAEDGYAYRYPREQYSVLLPAGKSRDLLLLPEAEGTYAVYDRALALSNAGAADGGLFTHLVVGDGEPPPNSPPTAVDDGYTAVIGEALVVAPPGVLGNDSDADGDALTAVLVQAPAEGSLELAADGGFTYTPAPEATGTFEFTYAAFDGEAESAPATVTLTVLAAPNQPPVATADEYTVEEDGVLTVAAPGVLGNDSDPEGGELTAILAADVAHGTLALAADGAFTYTPEPDFNGEDGFSYRASDGIDSSDPVAVTLTVTAVNDTPVAGDDSYAAVAGEPLTVTAPGVLENDSDVDGDALTAVLIDGPGHGTLDLAADGGFTYTAEETFSGSVQFTYAASDGELESAPATVTIEVSPAAENQPPVANDDYALTQRGVPVTIEVLANDSDPDGALDPASVTLTSQPRSGSAEVNPDGTVTFTPAVSGSVSFTYTVADDLGAVSNTATIRVDTTR